MPTFKIKSPDGKTYNVKAPEGTTAEQAMLKLRDSQTASREDEPWYQDMAEGVGLSGLETYYGIKDLVVGTDDEDKATLEDWRQDAGQSGWGTAGQVVGEIGQMLIPGGVATKGLRLASKAGRAGNMGRKARAFTRALGDSASAGSLGALRAPDIGETRGGNAATELAGAAVGEVGGYALGKAIRGATRTPAGQRMLDAGVPVTPGQAAESKFIEGLESVAEVTPLIAHGVKRARKYASDAASEKALKLAAAPGKTVTSRGTKGVSELKAGFNEAYGDAWAGATSLSNSAKTEFIDTATKASGKMTKKQKRSLKGLLEDFKALSSDVDPVKFQALDNDMRKRISASAKDYDFQELLVKMRKVLRDGAPAEVSEKLAAVDRKYGSYLVVRRAAKNAAADSGEFGGKGLIGAVKAIGKDAAGEGTAPLQQYATDAAQTVGRDIGGAPLEWFRRVAGITPTPFPMRAGGRFVLGQTAPQKVATKVADKVPQMLRRPGVYGAGANLEDQEWWKR